MYIENMPNLITLLSPNLHRSVVQKSIGLITCTEMYPEMIMVMLQVTGLTVKDIQES